jgi:hypothetical protein
VGIVHSLNTPSDYKSELWRQPRQRAKSKEQEHRGRILGGYLIFSIHGLLLAFTLRGVNIGDSCRHAADVEVASGAHPVLGIERMLTMDLLAFDDTTTSGEQDRISYSCSHELGTVNSITISSHAGTAQQAKDLFKVKKASLVGSVGMPDYDTDNLSDAQRARINALAAGLLLGDTAASWNLGDHLILQLLIAKHPQGETWDVTISMSPAYGKPLIDRKETPSP